MTTAKLYGVTVAGLLVAALPCFSQSLGGCAIMPSDSYWNTPVDQLSVHSSSATWVATMGGATGLHPDFGTVWQGAPIGIPYVVVPSDQAMVPISFEVPEESDPGPYPVPADAPIEGGAASDGDRHVLVIRQGECVLYELYYAFPVGGGSSWDASSGAVYPLGSNQLRPDTWTSGDAAGLPILPGLVRYDEVVEQGEIRHALRFTASQTRNQHLWPARHDASGLTGAQYPPMGARFRLRADFDISGFSAEVQVILIALKKYGMVLADNGSSWYVSGAPDARWDDDALSDIAGVTGADFEAVDASVLMLDPDSAATPHVFSDGFESGSTSWW
jgi:hypothetical protein